MDTVQLLHTLLNDLPADAEITEQQIEQIITEKLLATAGRVAMTPELYQLIQQHRLNQTKRMLRLRK